MNLLETILQSGNGAIVRQIAGNFGLNESDTQGAVAQMLPAITRAMHKNMSSTEGLAGLMAALQGGNHGRYLDDISLLGAESTRNDGNSILGHLLGSKDVSRNIAGHAAKETGIEASLLKKMLPVIAAVAMGALSKKAVAQSGGSMQIEKTETGSNGAMGFLASFIDADNDGSVVDDLLGMAKRFF